MFYLIDLIKTLRMNDIKLLFGKQLKHLREERNITQEKLAEILDISPRGLSAIECGKNFVTAQTIEKICYALEITPKQLFDFNFELESTQNTKEKINILINNNEQKLQDIYKLLKALLS